MRISKKFIVGLLTAASLTTGCTTYYNGAIQEIAVHTAGVDAVDCVFETKGRVYTMMAPGNIKIDRSPDEVKIICKKAGYVDNIKYINSVIMTKNLHGNIVTGYVPGTLYDFASKSVYTYPDVVMIDMKLDSKRLMTSEKSEEYLLLKKNVPIKIAPKEQTEEEQLDEEIKADTAISKSLKK